MIGKTNVSGSGGKFEVANGHLEPWIDTSFDLPANSYIYNNNTPTLVFYRVPANGLDAKKVIPCEDTVLFVEGIWHGGNFTYDLKLTAGRWGSNNFYVGSTTNEIDMSVSYSQSFPYAVVPCSRNKFIIIGSKDCFFVVIDDNLEITTYKTQISFSPAITYYTTILAEFIDDSTVLCIYGAGEYASTASCCITVDWVTHTLSTNTSVSASYSSNTVLYNCGNSIFCLSCSRNKDTSYSAGLYYIIALQGTNITITQFRTNGYTSGYIHFYIINSTQGIFVDIKDLKIGIFTYEPYSDWMGNYYRIIEVIYLYVSTSSFQQKYTKFYAAIDEKLIFKSFKSSYLALLEAVNTSGLVNYLVVDCENLKITPIELDNGITADGVVAKGYVAGQKVFINGGNTNTANRYFTGYALGGYSTTTGQFYGLSDDRGQNIWRPN